jgi:hypothetical protein
MSYFVSRQMYWPAGLHVVEVAVGGPGAAGVDMIAPRWPRLGEGKEYVDPRVSVEAARLILEAWTDLLRPNAGVAEVRCGTPKELDSPCPDPKAWGAAEYARHPVCTLCHIPLKGEKLTHLYGDQADLFCSQACVDEDLFLEDHITHVLIEDKETDE